MSGILRYLGPGYILGVPGQDMTAAEVAALPDGQTIPQLEATRIFRWEGDAVPTPPVPWRGFRWKSG